MNTFILKALEIKRLCDSLNSLDGMDAMNGRVDLEATKAYSAWGLYEQIVALVDSEPTGAAREVFFNIVSMRVNDFSY